MLQQKLTEIFASKTRDEWDAIMLGTDICYAPVLAFEEAIEHPHNSARSTFVEQDGIKQAAPAPRFSRTVPELPAVAVAPGAQTDEVLSAAGLAADEIAALRESGAIA